MDNYTGLDVHRAARIGAAGHGGQIVISSVLQSLLSGEATHHQWHFAALGAFSLKGLSRTEELYQLNAPGLAEGFPPIRAKRSARVRLPSQLTSLVDRVRETDQVASMLSDHQVRLVTLTGAGGIGKSRLALAVAEQVSPEYPDGVFFVGLAPLADPDQVLSAIADAAGIPVTASAMESLVDALSAQRVLLVLDNFEQVVGAAQSVSQLLGRCPGVNALTTSRVALRVAGEHEYQVEPLGVPAADDLDTVTSSAAARLFAERAKAVQPSFALDGNNFEVVAEICRRLDGLPLALELAAARLRMLTPAALLAQLNKSLDVLGSGPTDLPERQRTLRSTIDWSHQLLSDDEQVLFRRLSVFAGGFTLDAAAAVWDDQVAVPAIIESLLDKSLVMVDTDAGAEPRFRLLATIREYGAEKLTAAGESDVIRNGHVGYFKSMAETWSGMHQGNGHGQAMKRFDEDWENLRTAMAWSLQGEDHQSAVAIAYSLWIYVWLRGHVGEIMGWMKNLWNSPVGLSPHQQGRMLWLVGSGYFEQGDYPRAVQVLDQAIESLEISGDEPTLAWAKYVRASALPALEVDSATILQECQQALARFVALDDQWGQCWAYTNLAMMAAAEGKPTEAAEHLAKSLDLATRLENYSMQAQAHTELGFTSILAGDLVAARKSLTSAVEIHRGISYREGLAYTLDALAGLALQEGDGQRAMVALGAAESIRERLLLRPWPAIKWFLDLFAQAADAVEDPELQAARSAAGQMDPLTAAELALDLGR